MALSQTDSQFPNSKLWLDLLAITEKLNGKYNGQAETGFSPCLKNSNKTTDRVHTSKTLTKAIKKLGWSIYCT